MYIKSVFRSYLNVISTYITKSVEKKCVSHCYDLIPFNLSNYFSEKEI